MSASAPGQLPELPDRPDVAALVAAYLEGTLDADRCAELNTLLDTDPDARRVFVAMTVQSRWLTETFTDRLGHEKKSPAPPPKPRGAAHPRTRTPGISRSPRPIPFIIYPISIAAAALLTAAIVVVYLLAFTTDPQPDPIKPNRPGTPGPAVATLIEVSGGGDLRTPHGFPAEGEDFSAGEYTLTSGGAEFMLTNAVNVKLEGDTRLLMHHDMNVVLTRGSAGFVVPKDAKGFTVALPGGARVVDLGTAFTVDIDDDGEATIRVTDGSVRIEPAEDAEPFVLSENMSVALADRGATVGAITKRIVPVSYAYIGELQPGPAAGHPETQDRLDTDGIELIDGIVGSEDFEDHAWVGIPSATPNPTQPRVSVLFDLGERRTIRAVSITYLVDHDGHLLAPGRAVVATGDNEEALEIVAEDAAFDNAIDPDGLHVGAVRSHTIEFATREVRYLRLDLSHIKEWLFLGEVEIVGVTPNLTPSTTPRGARLQPEQSGKNHPSQPGDPQ